VTDEDEAFVDELGGFGSFLTRMDTEKLHTVSKRSRKKEQDAFDKRTDYDKESSLPDYERKARSASDWEQQTVQRLPVKEAESGRVKKADGGPLSLQKLVQEKEEKEKAREETDERLRALKSKLDVKREKQRAKVQAELKKKKLLKHKEEPVVFKPEEFEWSTGKLPGFLYTAQHWSTEADLLLYLQRMKEHIAALAFAVVEDPQANYRRLHDLQILCEHVPLRPDHRAAKKGRGRQAAAEQEPEATAVDPQEERRAEKRHRRFMAAHEQARQLAALSLLAVFKDILPGYRVRMDAEDLQEEGVKLKKEVLVLRRFEHSMLGAYQRYLQFLERCLKGLKRGEEPNGLYMVAVRCLSGLLESKAEFNFRDNLLQLLVPLMGSTNDGVSAAASTAVESMFQADSSGEASLVAVRLIAAYVKASSYNARNEVLLSLLRLRITEDVASRLDGKKTHLSAKQKKRMTKAQRKADKETREVEREMEAARAEESTAVRARNQTDMVRAIFTVYFRILKKVQSSPLLPGVLAGLAQYGHLINVDFQVDMLSALKDVMRRPESSVAVIFQCAITAFENLKLHGNVVDVDLKEFYECVYQSMLRVPEEVDSVPLLLHCMRLMVSENRTVSSERAAAFCKRLSTIALYFPINGAIAALVTIQRLMTFHPPVRQLLEVSEDRANDSYKATTDSPDNCKALAATLWELNMLERHFHPNVAERAAKAMVAEPTRLLAGEVLQQFDVSKGGFNPPIQKPSAHPLQKQVAKNPNRPLYVEQEELEPSPFYRAIETVCEDDADDADTGFAAWYAEVAAYRRELELVRLQRLRGRMQDALAGYRALADARNPAIQKAAKGKKASRRSRRSE